jgi:hypothetical protein
MRRKRFLCSALIIVALSTISAWRTYAVSAAMPNGTVVIGTKAFDLSYANDPKNLNEITLAIVAGGEVYVKGFDGTWVNNTDFKTISPSVIPSVTYKNSTNVEIKYVAGDKIDEATSSLEVISIE